MSQDIIWQGKNKAGKIFTMRGDLKRLQEHYKELISVNLDVEDDENYHGDYSLSECQVDTDGRQPTKEERLKEIQKLKDVMDKFDRDGYLDTFLNLPRKKNGTLAKNRVTRLWRGDTFAHYWEDSYGFNGPELIVRNVGDYEAHICIEHRTEGY